MLEEKAKATELDRCRQYKLFSKNIGTILGVI